MEERGEHHAQLCCNCCGPFSLDTCAHPPPQAACGLPLGFPRHGGKAPLHLASWLVPAATHVRGQRPLMAPTLTSLQTALWRHMMRHEKLERKPAEAGVTATATYVCSLAGKAELPAAAMYRLTLQSAHSPCRDSFRAMWYIYGCAALLYFPCLCATGRHSPSWF